MRKLLFFMVPALLAISCSENPFEEMVFRTTEDPFYDVPAADSTSLERTVRLSWKSDAGSDSFRLMRAHDRLPLRFSCIYEGTETEYTDTDIAGGSRYVYRLDKVRGKKNFAGRDYAFGYSAFCRKDSCEPNDTEAEATFLEHDLECNLPCVRYETGNKEDFDCDWFCIELPPRRSADIIVVQHNLKNGGKGLATDLNFQLAGSMEKVVTQEIANVIKNPDNTTKKFFFRIYPKTTGLLSDTNTTVVEYTVSLNQIRNYSL